MGGIKGYWSIVRGVLGILCISPSLLVLRRLSRLRLGWGHLYRYPVGVDCTNVFKSVE